MKRIFSVALCAAFTLTLACGYGMAQRNPATNKPADPLNQLSEEEAAQGWRLLFDGETLDGWESDGRGEWYVEDGMIIGKGATTHLFSESTYKNFYAQWDVCTYDVAIPKQRMGNSGIFVRGFPREGSPWPIGYEVQVDPYDINNPTSGIYGKGRAAQGELVTDAEGNWIPEGFMHIHEGRWVHQKVLVIDNHIMVWTNGVLTTDWVDESNEHSDAGHIALQNHHGSNVVLFANIKIKELD